MRTTTPPVSRSALGELVRMREPPDHWMPELVDAVEELGPVVGWDADAALSAAARVLALADERRALRDLERIMRRRAASEPPLEPPSGVRSIAWLESRLAHGGALFPAGMPPAWLGQSVDAYGVPTGPRSSVSYAIRWHGDRPAILWEQTGETVQLTAPVAAPEWRSGEATGEALWPAPVIDTELRPHGEPQRDAAPRADAEPGSFS